MLFCLLLEAVTSTHSLSEIQERIKEIKDKKAEYLRKLETTERKMRRKQSGLVVFTFTAGNARLETTLRVLKVVQKGWKVIAVDGKSGTPAQLQKWLTAAKYYTLSLNKLTPDYVRYLETELRKKHNELCRWIVELRKLMSSSKKDKQVEFATVTDPSPEHPRQTQEPSDNPSPQETSDNPSLLANRLARGSPPAQESTNSEQEGTKLSQSQASSTTTSAERPTEDLIRFECMNGHELKRFTSVAVCACSYCSIEMVFQRVR